MTVCFIFVVSFAESYYGGSEDEAEVEVITPEALAARKEVEKQRCLSLGVQMERRQREIAKCKQRLSLN